ncbi:MAG: prepilin-type N-terminal cleavage/methylation domain-containing protein [Candidatus Omnitrophica bacterium]|nr:prepilin-type N-terminal cleavage/methylation domain-containing protein [Candidatus Omnitrophota bacterium]
MKKIKAVSLIEMMVVLGIITMLMGLTTVYFFNYKAGAALKISANNIMAALNQARSLAITHQIEHGVAFDPANSEYFIFAKPDQLTRQLITTSMKTASGVIIESTTLPVDSHVLISRPAEIFNITGSAEDNASIFLKNSQGKYYTLTIVNATGRIKIYNYQKL